MLLSPACTADIALLHLSKPRVTLFPSPAFALERDPLTCELCHPGVLSRPGKVLVASAAVAWEDQDWVCPPELKMLTPNPSVAW